MADVGIVGIVGEYNPGFLGPGQSWKSNFMNVSAAQTFCFVILPLLVITEKEEGDFVSGSPGHQRSD